MIKLKYLLSEAYDFSSTQVNIPDSDKNKFINFCKSIPKENIYNDPLDDTKGIEDEPHITVLYGLHTDDVNDVKNVLKDFTGSITVKLGKISLFKNDKFDVLKIDVESDDLKKLNSIIKTLKNENKYPVYHPHLTLAYVKKGTCDKYEGDSRFEGQSYTFDHILFSEKHTSNKNKIKLIKDRIQENKTSNLILYRGLESEFNPNHDMSHTDAPNGYSTWTDNKELAKQYAGINGYIYKIELPMSELKDSYIDNDGERALVYKNNKPAGLNGVKGNEYLVYHYHDLFKINDIKRIF